MNVMFDLAGQPYDYHDEYYSINTGAHRKGGIELVTPTLTHHLGYWFSSQTSGVAPQRAVARYGAIADRYVMALYAELRDWDRFECNFEYSIGDDIVLGLFGAAYAISAAGTISRYEVTTSPLHFALKDAIESDNRILFLKAHWCGLKVMVRCEFHSEFFTISRFVTVIESGALPDEVAELDTHLSAIAHLDAADPSSLSRSYIFLHQGFWERFDRALFQRQHPFAVEAGEISSRVFADFRGLVLAGNDVAPHGAISTGAFASGKQRGRPFDDAWPLEHLIPAIWPFLTAKEGLDLKRREFTASFMLGKRAVYITALGPQPPADAGFRCAPLNYFLVARPISDWQLGALVDRLHLMGTVRLAALMELQALRTAGANLRDLEQEAENARKAIEDNNCALAYQHYQRIMGLLAHKDAHLQPIFRAGLQFRVERSRYYVRRFADFVPFLEMSPIEGYQQYDHFVQSRLGGIYDYINRLGTRQERATAGATGIFQAISLKEGAEANVQNAIISRTIEKLQTKAEIALLAVIVPHYLMEIVRGFQDEYKHGEKLIVSWFYAIWGVGLMLAFISLATYVTDKLLSGDTDAVEKILLKYLVLTMISAGIVIAMVR